MPKRPSQDLATENGRISIHISSLISTVYASEDQSVFKLLVHLNIFSHLYKHYANEKHPFTYIHIVCILLHLLSYLISSVFFATIYFFFKLCILAFHFPPFHCMDVVLCF